MGAITLPEMTKIVERRNTTQEMTSEQRFIEEKKLRGRRGQTSKARTCPIVPIP